MATIDKRFSPLQLNKLGPVLGTLANGLATYGMVKEMYYAPTYTRPLPYLALADWCEEYGDEQQRKVIEPAREIARLLTDRERLNTHGLLAKHTKDDYPITHRFLRHTLISSTYFWMDQHVLGPKKATVFAGDRSWSYYIEADGAGPFWDWNEQDIHRPFTQSVSFASTAMYLLGKVEGRRRRTFRADKYCGDWGEIHIHPLFILWWSLNSAAH